MNNEGELFWKVVKKVRKLTGLDDVKASKLVNMVWEIIEKEGERSWLEPDRIIRPAELTDDTP